MRRRYWQGLRPDPARRRAALLPAELTIDIARLCWLMLLWLDLLPCSKSTDAFLKVDKANLIFNLLLSWNNDVSIKDHENHRRVAPSRF